MNNETPDLLVSIQLQTIANELENKINKIAGEQLGIALFVFNSEPGGRINYISNCKRQDVMNALTSIIDA